MGVDAAVYFDNSIMPEALVYSILKAHGVNPDRDNGPNVFSASRFVRHPIESIGFSVIEDISGCDPKDKEPRGEFIAYRHQTNEGPLGPCQYFAGRSNARVIALFRTVAERFGGVLQYSDYNNSAKIFYGIDDEDSTGTAFEKVCARAFETPKAVVSREDIEKSSYDWYCEEHGEPMGYDSKCTECNAEELKED